MSSYGLVTLTDPNSESDPDSDPFSVPDSWDWNQNLTPCGMKSSEQYIYNVANFVYSLNRNRKWNHDPAT